MPNDPGPIVPETASRRSVAKADPRVNILLVDDEPRNLTVLETILDDPGYRLVRAESGDKALLALVAGDFAAIVLDIHMPGMSGFELAQLIKQRRKSASIPIIFLTAHYSEDRHVIEGYQTGAVDYLLKPINPAIVRSKVAVFAELYRKTRESNLANQALLAEITERRRVQEEMRTLNAELEARVAERTSELQAANSALEQTQAELRTINLRKDQFLAMLGHELRNPLGAIRNAISVLQMMAPEQTEMKWCHDVIHRQSEQLTRLVGDLLDVSRISRGNIQLEKQIIELEAAVREAIETCRPLIEARRHSLVATFCPRPLPVEGDHTRLTQVIANLINNAAKYTDEGGCIDVALEEEAGPPSRAVLHVRDNGCGLDQDAMEKLFDLFYQAETNIARSDGGLGVGLAVVRSLVEMHGGSVEAKSEGRGHGSEFIVRLPIATRADDGAAAAPNAAETSTPPREILVVDDNVDAARSLAMILKLSGHRVQLAYDGLQAMEMALRRRPDVVFLDIGLPEMNGYQVCRALREQGLADTLIVAISGYGQDADRQLADEAGFNFHLVKPANIAAIQQLLATTSSRNFATDSLDD